MTLILHGTLNIDSILQPLMSSYRIVCTEQEPFGNSPKHAHIVAVGTGTSSDKATEKWTLEQVIQAIDKGTRFYTIGDDSGKTAEVEKWWCGLCVRYHIRSSPDAVKDNNLDSLRYCRWNS